MNRKNIKFIIIFPLSLVIILLIVFGLMYNTILLNYHIKKGNNYYKEGKLYESINEYKISLDYDNENNIAKKNLSYVFYKEGLNEISKNNLNKAESNLLNAINILPDNYESYFELANVYLIKNEKIKAITNYEKSLKLNPNNPEAYNKLGNLYYETLNYKMALDSFEKSIKYKEPSTETYNKIGSIFLKLNRYKDAKEAFNNTLNIKNNDFDANFNLGGIFSSEGNLDEAIKYFEKAVEQNEKNYTILKIIGDYYFNKKNYKKALIYYDKVIKTSPSDYNSYLKLSKIHLFNRSYGNLEEILKKANAIYKSDKKISSMLELTSNFLKKSAELEELKNYRFALTQDNITLTRAESDPDSYKVFDLNGYIIALTEEKTYQKTYEIALLSWDNYLETYVPSEKHARLKTSYTTFQSKGRFSLKVKKNGTVPIKLKEDFGNFTQNWDLYEEATPFDIKMYKESLSLIAKNKEISKKNKIRIKILNNEIPKTKKSIKAEINKW